MKKTPDLYDLIRADQVRAEQRAPRKGRNPWESQDMDARRTYADPTADAALRNIERERRKQSKTPR